MASNAFGQLFKITTWGESHGKAIGVVIDGCPAGILISEDMINQELIWRAPGNLPLTSPRKEPDQVEILSGVFEGYTTAAPISLIIWNRDANSAAYEPLKHLFRPGHANYTYLQKYGHFDYRGGGRASARETACRVAAGAIAKQLLASVGVNVVAYLQSVATHACHPLAGAAISPTELREQVRSSPLFCPCSNTAAAMMTAIEAIKQEGDSIGGVVEAVAMGVPAGWGDPVYEKLQANLAKAMLSIPAAKGFELGSGFNAQAMRGSEHNDLFNVQDHQIHTTTNHAGGTLGGISTGMPIVIRVPFKPPSSIQKSQETVDTEGQRQEFTLPPGSRHDPCVAIRAVPVVEAMFALVLVDAMLMHRLVK